MIEEITKAMDAHSMWRNRLQGAVETGSIDIATDIISMDNQCAFGKWLYGPELPEEIKASEVYNDITRLHAQFHQEAGGIALLATTGKKKEAEVLLSGDSKYNELSKKLLSSLISWKKQLK